MWSDQFCPKHPTQKLTPMITSSFCKVCDQTQTTTHKADLPLSPLAELVFSTKPAELEAYLTQAKVFRCAYNPADQDFNPLSVIKGADIVISWIPNAKEWYCSKNRFGPISGVVKLESEDHSWIEVKRKATFGYGGALLLAFIFIPA